MDPTVEAKIRLLKTLGYAGVALTTISVLSVCITLPVVYNHVQSVRAKVQQDSIACKVILPSPF